MSVQSAHTNLRHGRFQQAIDAGVEVLKQAMAAGLVKGYSPIAIEGGLMLPVDQADRYRVTVETIYLAMRRAERRQKNRQVHGSTQKSAP